MYYKYNLQKKQVSTDNGETWYDVSPLETRKGSVVGTYDTYSDCMLAGLPVRWVNIGISIDHECVGYDKHYMQKKQVSYDSGSTWTDVTPLETRVGDVYEYNSPDCGWEPQPQQPQYQYLTFESIEDNNAFKFSETIEYSLNNGSWNTLTSGNSVTANSGDTIMWRASGLKITEYGGIGIFTSTKNYDVYGNIMSLVSGNNFANATTVANYNFCNLFDSGKVIHAGSLILPATTLGKGCYMSMFWGCSGLTETPALPATTLSDYCYQSMFLNCRSLTTAPELPATTLGTGCYLQMFQNCSGITTAPELPATTLTEQCYSNMFLNCSGLTTAPDLPAPKLAKYCYSDMFASCVNLNYIKCLATNISANGCTQGWVSGVAATGTFVKAASMSSWKSGAYGIPKNWTVQNA